MNCERCHLAPAMNLVSVPPSGKMRLCIDCWAELLDAVRGWLHSARPIPNYARDDRMRMVIADAR